MPLCSVLYAGYFPDGSRTCFSWFWKMGKPPPKEALHQLGKLKLSSSELVATVYSALGQYYT